MRRSVAQIKADTLKIWRGTSVFVLSPDDCRVWLVTSKQDGCLTHLVRYATAYGSRPHLTFHAQCGNMLQHGRPVSPDDEMFGCARCLQQALKYAEPTFNLIPTTGCEVSGGKRKGRTKQ